MAETSEKAPSSSSRFLSLPAEIRIQIYEHAVTRPEPVEISPLIPQKDHFASLVSFLGFSSKHTDLGATDTAGISLNLLRTCRQIYREATPLFYGTNTFRIDVRMPDATQEVERTYGSHYPWPLLHDYSSDLETRTCYAETDKGRVRQKENVALLYFLHCIGEENRKLLRSVELYAPAAAYFPRLLPIYAEIIDKYCPAVTQLRINLVRYGPPPMRRRSCLRKSGYSTLATAHLRACVKIGMDMLAAIGGLEISGNLIDFLYDGEFRPSVKGEGKVVEVKHVPMMAIAKDVRRAAPPVPVLSRRRSN